jgi:FtsP/CotA-like multicopper oxidase with cupredoxin domain
MNRKFSCNRRQVLASTAVLAAALALPRSAAAASTLNLRMVPGTVALRPNGAPSPIWQLEAQPQVLRFKRGDDLQVAVSNETAGPLVLNWIGINGVSAAEPLASQPALAPGGRSSFLLPLRHAGTFLIDPRLLGDGKERPARPRVLVVEGSEAATADRDEVLLIEDWRLRADGTALTPGSDPKDTVTLFTVNGAATQDIKLRPNERLRLRIVNGCARSVVGLKIDGVDVRVVAIDGQPSEPFPARDGQLVLAPGARSDVITDATMPAGSSGSIVLFGGGPPVAIAKLMVDGVAVRPAPLPLATALPSNGLPAELRFQNALRAELAFDGQAKADWIPPANFALTTPPAFKAKRGRVVMLTVANRSSTPAVVRLHGHHARLLDRLDDGWKPYWIDTLLLDIGQTQRIAFLAEHTGNWLIEAMQIGWASPKLVRWFAVEN